MAAFTLCLLLLLAVQLPLLLQPLSVMSCDIVDYVVHSYK